MSNFVYVMQVTPSNPLPYNSICSIPPYLSKSSSNACCLSFKIKYLALQQGDYVLTTAKL